MTNLRTATQDRLGACVGGTGPRRSMQGPSRSHVVVNSPADPNKPQPLVRRHHIRKVTLHCHGLLRPFYHLSHLFRNPTLSQPRHGNSTCSQGNDDAIRSTVCVYNYQFESFSDYRPQPLAAWPKGTVFTFIWIVFSSLESTLYKEGLSHTVLLHRISRVMRL